MHPPDDKRSKIISHQRNGSNKNGNKNNKSTKNGSTGIDNNSNSMKQNHHQYSNGTTSDNSKSVLVQNGHHFLNNDKSYTNKTYSTSTTTTAVSHHPIRGRGGSAHPVSVKTTVNNVKLQTILANQEQRKKHKNYITSRNRMLVCLLALMCIYATVLLYRTTASRTSDDINISPSIMNTTNIQTIKQEQVYLSDEGRIEQAQHGAERTVILSNQLYNSNNTIDNAISIKQTTISDRNNSNIVQQAIKGLYSGLFTKWNAIIRQISILWKRLFHQKPRKRETIV